MPKLVNLKKKPYEAALKDLQIELVRMQEWVKETGTKVVVLFEGRDAAGKGGAIKRIAEKLNPRVCRIVALDKPTERERSQWYFQRYAAQLPAGGEIVLFDRSWYNRAGVEVVMGFCSEDEHREFLKEAPIFEQLLVSSGIILVKYWFSVSDDEQELRFQERIENPMKRWKFSPMDLESRNRWAQYSQAKDEMFAATDTQESPWWVVEANDKRRARLNCVAHLLRQIPYKAVHHPDIKLPKLKKADYQRPPYEKQRLVPELLG